MCIRLAWSPLLVQAPTLEFLLSSGRAWVVRSWEGRWRGHQDAVMPSAGFFGQQRGYYSSRRMKRRERWELARMVCRVLDSYSFCEGSYMLYRIRCSWRETRTAYDLSTFDPVAFGCESIWVWGGPLTQCWTQGGARATAIPDRSPDVAPDLLLRRRLLAELLATRENPIDGPAAIR